MRDGADHLIRIPYEEVSLATCPIRAVEPWIAVRTNAGWGMTQGYLFPHIVRGRQRISERVVVSNSTTNDRLNQAALSSGKGEPRFLHAFVPIRGGGFTSVCR